MEIDFKAILEHLEKRPKHYTSFTELERYMYDREVGKWFEEHERLCKGFEKELREIKGRCANSTALEFKTTYEFAKEILGE